MLNYSSPPIKMICSHWCIHFDISLLRSIQNWYLGSFWIFIIARDYSFLLYAPPVLALAVEQYVVMILIIIIFFTGNNIHEQRPRFLSSWPVLITLHDTSSTSIIAVPLLCNDSPEMVTLLYPELIVLVLKHVSVLLYIFSLMVILIQLLFTSMSPIIAIS